MYTVPKLEDFSARALDAAKEELLRRWLWRPVMPPTDQALEEFRNRWLARKNGLLAQVNELWLKAAPGSAKREAGQRVNELKQRAEELV